jgi:hypothetical protein
VGDKVLIKRGTENKYETPYQGPYSITQVNENGTVRMMIKNVEDTINIRRLTPYLDTDNIPHGGECSMPNTRVRQESKPGLNPVPSPGFQNPWLSHSIAYLTKHGLT